MRPSANPRAITETDGRRLLEAALRTADHSRIAGRTSVLRPIIWITRAGLYLGQVTWTLDADDRAAL